MFVHDRGHIVFIHKIPVAEGWIADGIEAGIVDGFDSSLIESHGRW